MDNHHFFRTSKARIYRPAGTESDREPRHVTIWRLGTYRTMHIHFGPNQLDRSATEWFRQSLIYCIRETALPSNYMNRSG